MLPCEQRIYIYNVIWTQLLRAYVGLLQSKLFQKFLLYNAQNRTFSSLQENILEAPFPPKKH
jgi:hypothetical protein